MANDIPEHILSMMAAMFPPQRQSASVYRLNMQFTPQPSLILRLMLSMLSQSAYPLVRKETLPVLFELVLWDDDEFNGPSREWWYEGMKEKNGKVYSIPESWKYIKVLYLEKGQLSSYQSLSTRLGLKQNDIVPSQRFFIMRDLPRSHDKYRRQEVYQADVNIIAYTQSSTSFFNSLFGIKTHPSILETPLKLKSNGINRKKPRNGHFEHIEDFKPICFSPNAFLERSGRTSDDLGLDSEHYFNKSPFGIGLDPFAESDAGHVRESIGGSHHSFTVRSEATHDSKHL